jgi:hypothetical protein
MSSIGRMVLQVDSRAEAPALDDQLAIAVQRLSSGGTSIAEAMASLLDSLLYLPQYPDAQLSQQDVSRGRLSLAVYQVDGKNFAPAFSSVDALTRFAKPGTAYAAISGKALLGTWSDDWLIVNPGSRYRLILNPQEIHALSRGELPQWIELDSP